MKQATITEATKIVSATLNYYRFDCSKHNEKIAYFELYEKLKKSGLKMFDTYAHNKTSRFYKDTIRPLNGLQIEIETDFIFNDQFNTSPTTTSEKGLRLFDWAQAIYPNLDIKEGYYMANLEQLNEMRQNKCNCGYCGAQYYQPTIEFCEKCLSSEHLTLDSLYLLRLQPISSGDNRINRDLPAGLIEKYNEAQLIGRTARLKKSKNQKLAQLQRDIVNAQREYDFFSLLIANNINFDNCIYYTHIDTFSFGWRTPFTVDQKNEMWDILDKAGILKNYNVEVKTGA